MVKTALQPSIPGKSVIEVHESQGNPAVKSLPYNFQRFQGDFEYDEYRPRPPSKLLDMLTTMAGLRHCGVVVDFGSGTGLSTRIWAQRANLVVGIEPSDRMRERAKRQTTEANVVYCRASSQKTRLPNRCADIVTCSQSLHWMEPDATFAEAARIIRPDGVFAAYDHEWPPDTFQPELEKVYYNFMWRVKVLENKHQTSCGIKIWPREEHLHSMRSSGHFRFTVEKHVCHVEKGNAERFIGIILSKGGVAALLRAGLSEREIGLDNLREVAMHLLGSQQKPWRFRYKVRIAIV